MGILPYLTPLTRMKAEMRKSNRAFLAHFSFCLLWAFACLGASTFAEASPGEFLQSYCIKCHGSEYQKSDRRFDTLPARIGSLADLERYRKLSISSISTKCRRKMSGNRARMSVPE
jgi:hypothetical protein